MLLLLIILAVITFFVYLEAYSSVITKSVCQYFHVVGDDELNLRSQVRDLKAEQETISMSDEFAKYMKLERKIDKFLTQVKDETAKRNKKVTKLTYAITIAVYVLHTITMLTLMVIYRNTPLLQMSTSVFIPLNRFVAMPTGEPGAVGVTSWMFVCHTFIHRTKKFIVG